MENLVWNADVVALRNIEQKYFSGELLLLEEYFEISALSLGFISPQVQQQSHLAQLLEFRVPDILVLQLLRSRVLSVHLVVVDPQFLEQIVAFFLPIKFLDPVPSETDVF